MVTGFGSVFNNFEGHLFGEFSRGSLHLSLQNGCDQQNLQFTVIISQMRTVRFLLGWSANDPS
jgi:hypothetical protein